ncbi:MAG: hypothetical protein ACRD1N_02045 [Terriglobia bacterium]
MKRLLLKLVVLFLSCLAGAPAILTAAPATGEGASHHTGIFEWINLAILVIVLVYVLRKPVAQFFVQRSSAVRESLEGGQKALAAARAELEGAEEKLRRLEQEVMALKTSALKEIDLERERMRRASAEESARILEAAEQTIRAAALAAKLELKHFAAREASERAEKMIREKLDDQGQARLLSRFVEGLPPDGYSSHRPS